MNKILLGLCLVVVIQEFANAVESVMCNYYYQNVQRKVNNIQNNSNNLSSMAKQKLYNDLVIDVKQCISDCEYKKFDYCNQVAKEIEKNQ